MNRDSKIESLPAAIRGRANRRLQNGEAMAQIAEWLNTLAEVKALMAAQFGGLPIVEANLVSWKLGGYRHWQAQQEALDASVQFGQEAAEIALAAGGPLADQIALCLTARLGIALRKRPADTDGPGAELHRLRQLCADLVALRRGDQGAQWLRIEREKLDVELKEFEEEEAARRKEIEKRENAKKIDFSTYHASKEDHDQIAAMLKRI